MSKINIINNIINGDCAKILQKFPENFVDLTITSPPYDNLREYNGYTFDLLSICNQLYRITKTGGVCVWVVNDATIKGSETGTSFLHAQIFMNSGFKLHDTMIYEKNTSSFPAKHNGNRYTQIFEYMFVFSKDSPKTSNLICDKKNTWAGHTNWGKKTDRQKDGTLKIKENIKPVPEFSPRNNIWKYTIGGGFGQSDDIAYKHPATFPEELAKDHIITWSNPGDIVLDPMCGSGTTCKMANILKRKYIGIDISKEYCQIAKKRIQLIKNT